MSSPKTPGATPGATPSAGGAAGAAGAAGAGAGMAKTAMSMAGPAGAAASAAIGIAEGVGKITAANDKSDAAGSVRRDQQQLARGQAHDAISASLGQEGVVGSARTQGVDASLQARDIAFTEAKRREEETKTAAKAEQISAGMDIAGSALQMGGAGMDMFKTATAPKAGLKDAVESTKSTNLLHTPEGRGRLSRSHRDRFKSY